MEWWWAYLAIGVSVGFLAGLFGIGGGMIMVPMLVFVFTAKGFPAEHMMHLSLATSMATIVFTSLSSVGAHHRHGAVDWRVARAMAPGIVVGALAATLVAGFVPTRPLAVFFAVFMLYASLQMFFEVKPKPSRQLPDAAGLFGVGAGLVPAHADTIQVVIDKLVFSPIEINAKVGDTIEWVNKDILAHTATVRGDWDVMIAANKSASVVLKNAGAVEYYCRFHPNMKGQIIVVPK